jgi:iron complex outermembrane receptor protein
MGCNLKLVQRSRSPRSIRFMRQETLMNTRHSSSAAIAAVGACLCAASTASAQDKQPKVQEEVIVTATPLQERGLEVAQPTSVLRGDELERQIAASIGETLDSMLGISGTYFGPAASRPVIRGLSGERVLILEDGIGSLDVSSLSQDHAVTVESALARQIEIVKGPATLLYGNGTIGGVVNVLTDRVPTSLSERPITGVFELRGDTAMEEKTGAGHVDATLGSFAFHVDGYKRETGNIEIPDYALSDAKRAELEAAGEPVDLTRGEVRNSLSESDGGALGFSYVGDNGYIGVAASTFATNYGVPGPEEEEEAPAAAALRLVERVRPLASINAEGVSIDMKQDRYDLRGAFLRPDAALSAVRVLASYNDYEHTEFEPDGAPGTSFDQTGLDSRLMFDHAPLAGWRGTFGVQYRDVDFNAVGDEAFVPPSITENLGIFVFEERPFGDVTLELGARVENQNVDPEPSALVDYDKDSVNLSAGVVWKLESHYALSLNVTSTERHPTGTELYANGPHLAIGRFEIGDPSLDKETALTVDVGIHRDTGRLHYQLSAFYNDFSDYIFPLLTGDEADGLPVAQYVQADAEFQGLEGEVGYRLTESDAGTLSGRLAADYVRGKLKDGGDLPQVPPMRVGAELRFVRDRWDTGIGAWYYDKQDKVAVNELPSDSYTMVDADVGYAMPWTSGRLYVFLRGSNLLDEDARRHSSPLKDFLPLPGRSMTAGARVEF